MHVAIRELKSKLSRVLALAQGGEAIEVTSHGKPVARIVGIPPLTHEGLRSMMARGTLSWNGGKPNLAPPLALSPDGMPVSEVALEDRG